MLVQLERVQPCMFSRRMRAFLEAGPTRTRKTIKATVASVNADALIRLFDEVVSEITEALRGVDDWGLSGERETQYHHDVAADQAALDVLFAAGVGVLSEETGLQHGEREIVVVVDPVDGSTNASHGIPWYATSLCAVRDGQAVAATVANLATGTAYRAVAGQGASRDGQPIQTTGVTAMGDALITFSGYPPQHLGWRQFRVLGACALDVCGVADGTVDGFADCDDAHGVWDYLGAMLVCREAGGVCEDAFGRELITLDPAARRAPVAAATAELQQTLATSRRDF